MLLNETIATYKDGAINLEIKKREIFVVHEKNTAATKELRYSVFNHAWQSSWDYDNVGDATLKFTTLIGLYFCND